MTLPLLHTVMVFGPEPEAFDALRERFGQRGVLLLHTATPGRARLWLDTLRPDWAIATAGLADLGSGVERTVWTGGSGELLALLDARYPEPARGIVQWGRLRLDEPRGRLCLLDDAGRAIAGVNLPATELRLLACLLRQGGRALTRDALLAQAWPPHQRPQARSVDQVVRRLRVLLAPLGLDRSLHSLRGLGYRFDLDGLRTTAA